MADRINKKLTDLIPAPGQGASIVFSLSDLSDFSRILFPFARFAGESGRKLVHIRFVPDPDAPASKGRSPSTQAPGAGSREVTGAGSREVTGAGSREMPGAGSREVTCSGSREMPGAGSREVTGPSLTEEIPVPLNHRFRRFTVSVHEKIRQMEEGCIFVFDCLSELQTAWATDLMMVNFFSVTTPLLRSRGDTALFPLMALMHSDEASGKITQISDSFIAVCSDFKNIYLRAEKIGNQSGPLGSEHGQLGPFLPERAAQGGVRRGSYAGMRADVPDHDEPGSSHAKPHS